MFAEREMMLTKTFYEIRKQACGRCIGAILDLDAIAEFGEASIPIVYEVIIVLAV